MKICEFRWKFVNFDENLWIQMRIILEMIFIPYSFLSNEVSYIETIRDPWEILIIADQGVTN